MSRDAFFVDSVTLVDGATVLVTDRAGDIDPDTWSGLYHHDVRVLSRLEVTIDGWRPGLLTTERTGASAASAVGMLSTGEGGDPTGLLLRRWVVDGDVRTVLEIRTFDHPVTGSLRLEVEADFVPAQKGASDQRPAPAPWTVGSGLRATHESFSISVEAAGPAIAEAGALVFEVDAEPGRPWHAAVVFRPNGARDEGRSPATPHPSTLKVSSPVTRWQESATAALADLEALRVDVPALDLRYLAAGAPWYMALFGRDTLLASWEGLLGGVEPAVDVLRSLARYQGVNVDPATGEQPGRILHELRTGGAEVFGVASGHPYYGTVDASPLFVMLLSEVHRWGATDEVVQELLPAGRAALAWCSEYGDIDGDGYVEYDAHPGGLVNQGWKDSGDAMVHADGAQAESPIALAEVQAYVWAAYERMAELEERVGDADRADALRAEARRLRAAFHRDFWLADRDLVAMALDADKRPLAVASSNTGHCLWAGILDAETGDAAARRLLSPSMVSEWGLRTLAADEVAYNPLAYHLGSVWPHDTAIAVAGLRRYGHADGASRLAHGLLAAAEHFGWRLPELFGGFDETEVPHPVPYPTTCSPQAWSAAAPLLLLRVLLGLEPDVPAGRVRLAPRLPDDVAVTVTGIPVGGGCLDVRAVGCRAEVLAAPEGVVIEID